MSPAGTVTAPAGAAVGPLSKLVSSHIAVGDVGHAASAAAYLSNNGVTIPAINSADSAIMPSEAAFTLLKIDF